MTRYLIALAFAAGLCRAADPVSARLAHEARDAEKNGQIVRAYLLYAEAAARDPENPSYRANRDALASAAKLLTKADVENADIRADVKAAEAARDNPEPPIQIARESDWARDPDLQPIPRLNVNPAPATFDLRGKTRSLFEQVTAVYGIRAIFDPELEDQQNIQFAISNADFHTAMEALTLATGTFVFPVSQSAIFVARDTDAKRNQYEPNILLTFPLPNALEQKDLIEAANAVRASLKITTIGWDSGTRTVMIRDRVSRARVARALLEALLLPKGQLLLEIQFLTLDTDRNYHYGASLQTAFQLVDFGHIGGLKSVLPTLSSPLSFARFGGGATLFGIGLTDATLFAMYSDSFSQTLYDSTVAVSDGQTVSLHVGDKYPIAQTLYTGYTQASPSIYNPTPQITLQDLGLVLKITPHIGGDETVALSVDADLTSLGAQTFDSIPAIAERQFKGDIRLREGQWAVLAGMDITTQSASRNGLAGISQVPGLNEILSENTRDKQRSSTLLLLKPVITRLPVSPLVSPQFMVGSQHGERVIS